MTRIEKIDSLIHGENFNGKHESDFNEVREAAYLLVDELKALGYEGDTRTNLMDELHFAQTGTCYLTVGIIKKCDEDCDECWGEDENCEGYTYPLKIRIANHGDCYCTTDLTIDPQGLTAAQVFKIFEDYKPS